MTSLSWKLVGGLILVVAISVGLMAYLTNLSTTQEFRQYLARGNTLYSQRVSESLGQYYSQNGSWNGLQTIIDSMLHQQDDRLIVADSSGNVIADSGDQWLGRQVSTLGLEGESNIVVYFEVVGNFFLLTTASGYGDGYGRGYGSGGQQSEDSQQGEVYTESQSAFLEQVNGSLWVAGLAGAAAALFIDIILTIQLTSPLKRLSKGAHQIARGNLSYRTKISSRDEIGELAESFNQMASSLETSEQARRRLINDITHELRTPLTIIDGTTDGIIDGVFQPDTKHLLTIKEQSELLTKLINELRDLSLAELGQLKLELSPINLVDLARRKIEQMKIVGKNKGVKLKLQVAQDEFRVKVDPIRVEQVISNLLNNALSHTTTGDSITVSIKEAIPDSRQKLPQQYVLLSVADTGEGISKEHLPHIFDRFYRVEPSRARSEGGTGLGLAIVKQMVEAHNGKVWVESELAKGSTFYIALPLLGD